LTERQPITVIRDQLGYSSLAVTDRYLRNAAIMSANPSDGDPAIARIAFRERRAKGRS
jgi:hypothetical protein